MTVEATQIELRERRERALQHAGYSMLVPGLGQLAQRRFGTALLQFGTVTAYVAGAIGMGGRRAVLFALLWNLWSVIDAYRNRPD